MRDHRLADEVERVAKSRPRHHKAWNTALRVLFHEGITDQHHTVH